MLPVRISDGATTRVCDRLRKARRSGHHHSNLIITPAAPISGVCQGNARTEGEQPVKKFRFAIL
jgi:hypothetical protein